MIRTACMCDVPRIMVLADHFSASSPYPPADHETLPHFLRVLIGTPIGDIHVSIRDEVVTGMLAGMVSLNPMSGRRQAQELFYWVEPESRGNGVKLLRAFEKWAKDMAADEVCLGAPTERTERLYQRLGYTKLDTAYVRQVNGGV